MLCFLPRTLGNENIVVVDDDVIVTGTDRHDYVAKKYFTALYINHDHCTVIIALAVRSGAVLLLIFTSRINVTTSCDVARL